MITKPVESEDSFATAVISQLDASNGLVGWKLR